jgi:hypothetical protein
MADGSICSAGECAEGDSQTKTVHAAGSNRMKTRRTTRPIKASLSDGKVLSIAQKPDDAAAGLLVLCALVCGSVIFGFYMQPQQKQRPGPAAEYLATSSAIETHRSLTRAPNRSSETGAHDYSRHAGDEITNPPARAAQAQRELPAGAAKIRPPFKTGAYPGYAAPY